MISQNQVIFLIYIFNQNVQSDANRSECLNYRIVLVFLEIKNLEGTYPGALIAHRTNTIKNLRVIILVNEVNIGTEIGWLNLSHCYLNLIKNLAVFISFDLLLIIRFRFTSLFLYGFYYYSHYYYSCFHSYHIVLLLSLISI